MLWCANFELCSFAYIKCQCLGPKFKEIEKIKNKNLMHQQIPKGQENTSQKTKSKAFTQGKHDWQYSKMELEVLMTTSSCNIFRAIL